MSAINFRYRFVFDKEFFNDIKNKKFDSKPSVLTKLMYINDKSKGHSRTNNVMSKKVFEEILEENPNMIREVLRASFYDYSKDKFEEIGDVTERVIKIAIDLLGEAPYRTIIMTSENKVQIYKTNSHYQDVKEIDVKSGKEALEIINNFFDDCTGK